MRNPDTTESGFSEFWSEYPRKENKQAAKKSYNKINPDSDLQEIILCAIRKQKKSKQWTKNGGQYIPLPATWLNNKRWQDEGIDKMQEQYSNLTDGQKAVLEATRRRIEREKLLLEDKNEGNQV